MQRTPLRTFGTWFSLVLASVVFSASLVAAESPADLVALGLAEVPLAPSFDRETSRYTAQVPYATSAIILSGSAASPDTATILTRLNGAPPENGLPREIQLRPGLNRISLRVTADGAPLRDLPFAASASRFLAVHPDGHLMQAPLSGSSTLPTLPAEVRSGVVGVVAGGLGEYVLKSDGSIFTLSGSPAPASLGAGQAGVSQPRVVSAAAGGYINIALRNDGTVVTWPAPLATDARDVVAVAAGHEQVLTLNRQGRVCAYGGFNSAGELNVPAAAQTGVVAVTATLNRCLALRADGQLVQWGRTPAALATIPETATDIVAISATNLANLARTRDGTLVAWGSGFTPPPEIAGRVVAQWTTNQRVTALLDDGALIHWDNNSVATAITGFDPLFTPPLRNYELAVERTPASPALASLTINGGALTPTFDPDTLSYSVSLPYSAKTLDLGTTFAAPTTASLRTRIDGQRSTPGPPAATPLQIGVNQLELRVTADGQALRDFPIAASPTRSLGVSADGALMQLPISSSSHPALPEETASDIEGVFSGPFGDYALKADGRLIHLSGAAVPDEAQPTADGEEPARAPGVALAIGGSHALLLRADGSTFVWASGGTNPTLNIPEAARSGVVAVAATNTNCTALKADGTVVEWGGYFTGTWASQTSRIFMIKSVVTSSYSGGSVFGLMTDGKILDLTMNNSLDATLAQITTPFVSIAVAGSAVYGLTAEGGVLAWKSGSSTPLTTPRALQSGVVAIHGSPNHLLAIKTDGSVETWPAPTTTTPSSLPTSFARPLTNAETRVYRLRVELRAPDDALAHLAPLAPGTGPAAPDFAPDIRDYTLPGSTPANSITLNGQPFPGQPRLEVRVNNGPRMPVMAGQTLAIYSNGSLPELLAIRPDGTVYAHGATAGLIPLEAQTDVVSVALGENRAVALKADGTIIHWRTNTNSEPVALPVGIKATAIAAGKDFGAAILSTGRPVVWGGIPSSLTPFPDGAEDLVAIAAGASHLLVLRRDGRAIAWGGSSDGEKAANLAVPPEAQSNVVAIAAGFMSNLALRSDGRVVAWGIAYGDETPPALRLSVPPLLTHDVVAIAANPFYSRIAALKSDGTLVTWSTPLDGYQPEAYRGGFAIPGQSVAISTAWLDVLGQGADGKFRTPFGPNYGYPAEFFTQTFALPLNARLPLQTGPNTVALHATPRDNSSGPGQTYTYSFIRSTTPKTEFVRTDLSPDQIVPDGLNTVPFGLVRVGLSTSQTWLVRNVGDAALTINSLGFANLAPGAFSISGITTPLALAPGEEAAFTLSAHPTVTGFSQDNLLVHSDLPFGSPQILRVEVNGITPESWLAGLRADYFTAAERADPAREADRWGDFADPDGDGLPNLLEYAVFSSPKIADSGQVGTLSLEPPDAATGAPRRLTFTYTRSGSARVAGVLFEPEWSDDLAAGNWSGEGVSEQIISTNTTIGGNSYERVEASVALPNDAPRRFLRLRVTLPTEPAAAP